MMDDEERERLTARIKTLEAENAELLVKVERLAALEKAYQSLDRSSAIWRTEQGVLRRRVDKLQKDLAAARAVSNKSP